MHIFHKGFLAIAIFSQWIKTTCVVNNLNNGSGDRILLPEVDFGHNCQFNCYVNSTVANEAVCTKREHSSNSEFLKDIPCTFDKNKMRYVIGNKTSVYKIVKEGLKVLARSSEFEDVFHSRKYVRIYLYMNIAELTLDAFIGLEDFLVELQIFNVIFLHPCTFSKTRRLDTLFVDSGIIPSINLASLFIDPSPESHMKVPPFIRLHPEDTNKPLSFNLAVRCHRCESDSIYPDYVVVTFPYLSQGTSPSRLMESLTIVYVGSCPRIPDGLGCLLQLDNRTTYISNKSRVSFIINPTALTGFDIEINHREPGDICNDSGKDTLIILLTVWCTLISIALMLICILMCIFRGGTRQLGLIFPKFRKSSKGATTSEGKCIENDVVFKLTATEEKELDSNMTNELHLCDNASSNENGTTDNEKSHSWKFLQYD